MFSLHCWKIVENQYVITVITRGRKVKIYVNSKYAFIYLPPLLIFSFVGNSLQNNQPFADRREGGSLLRCSSEGFKATTVTIPALFNIAVVMAVDA